MLNKILDNQIICCIASGLSAIGIGLIVIGAVTHPIYWQMELTGSLLTIGGIAFAILKGAQIYRRWRNARIANDLMNAPNPSSRGISKLEDEKGAFYYVGPGENIYHPINKQEGVNYYIHRGVMTSHAQLSWQDSNL